MLIDTHCHLDAAQFDADRSAVIERARVAGVGAIVVPGVARTNFAAVAALAHSFEGGAYALGIHPMYVPDADEADLDVLEQLICTSFDDPRFVAIGEIGLDYFVPSLKEPAMSAKQQRFYQAQLGLAQRYGLPVLLHVRRSQDLILKYLRQHSGVSGIAHAFNGSFQQAQQFIDCGFALGIGGAMTFSRAKQIRRLAAQLPLNSLVLETDAPDLAPAWCGVPAVDGKPAERARNEPAELAGICVELARLRGLAVDDVSAATERAAYRVLPRLKGALAG